MHAMADDGLQDLPTLLLGAAGSIVEGIQERMAENGFADLRPAHGFAFIRITGSGSTVADLAAYLGVTKQAASQLAAELGAKGYVARRPHPSDGRSVLLVLTARGRAATRAADRAGAEVLREWTAALGVERTRQLRDDLLKVVPPGRIRPTW
jgi:DNA-binding MarR family transcriptional regulator